VRIGLDLGAQQVVIDGTGASNQLITGSAEAPCVVQVSPADLQALLMGQMNPMNAFLSGKLRIQGDMNLALQLQKLFQT
jgi:putative sterol carrier protein